MSRFIIILFSLLLVSCASTSLTDSEKDALYQSYIDENKLESIEKISPFRYSGWFALDDKHLILTASINKKYLVRLRTDCIELENSYALVIRNMSNITFDPKFDAISPSKFPKIRCRIKDIYPLQKGQEKEIAKLEDNAREAKVKANQTGES